MSHTPGEWSVWTTMDNTLCIHAMQAPGRPIIAHVEPIGKRKPVAGAGQSELDAPGDTPSDEEIANAQLIAASPALLAASRRALHHFEAQGEGDLLIAEELRAAIAKAEEVQP